MSTDDLPPPRNRKELYELIERVVDKCDDVANVVQTVTAKHV